MYDGYIRFWNAVTGLTVFLQYEVTGSQVCNLMRSKLADELVIELGVSRSVAGQYSEPAVKKLFSVFLNISAV